MKENATTVLAGARVRLVPYLECHVPTYHGWMQDEELLRLTCSEPLTLEEESANQKSWCEDPLKVTFIICALDEASGENGAQLTSGMCGDVNAFLTPLDAEDQEEEEGGDPPPAPEGPQPFSAELEVMVADASRRRRGVGREATLLLVRWLLRHVPLVARLVVKITDDNEPSRRLFEGLGFVVYKHMAVFEQTELRLDIASARELAERHWQEAGAQELSLVSDDQTLVRAGVAACAVADEDAQPAT